MNKKKKRERAGLYLNIIKEGLKTIKVYSEIYKASVPPSEMTGTMEALGGGVSVLVQMCEKAKPKWFAGNESELKGYVKQLYGYIKNIKTAEPQGVVFVNGGGRVKLYSRAREVFKDGLQELVQEGGALLGKGKFYS